MSRVKHNAVHQFSAGLNNAQTTGPASLPFQLPGLQGWKVVTENFATGHLYTGSTTPWEETETNGGATVAANGALLSNTGADNDLTTLQWTTPTLQPGAATKKLYLETSLTLTAATAAQTEIFVGFTTDVQGTNLIDTNGVTWVFADGIGFGKFDAATEIDFVSAKGSAWQTIGFGSNLTTATRTTLGCYYDGTNFNLYKDGAFVKAAAKETINDDTPTGVTCFLKCGTGEAQTLLVNYITLATEL